MSAKKKSFIHFGCWNNLCNENNTGLRDVIAKLKTHIKNPTTTTDVQFISVAGDNYYALKDKETRNIQVKKVVQTVFNKILENGTTTEKKDGKKDEKISYLSQDDIQKGFNQLQSIDDKIPINVIYGNHDLEKNKKFTVANNINCNNEQITVELPENTQYIGNNNCQMMEDQKNAVKKLKTSNKPNTSNINIDKFIIPSFDEDTFVCMIDSTVYSEDFNQGCYEKDKQVEIDKQNLDVLYSYNKIKNKESVKNIIIIGHHPITFEKGKSVDKTKVNTLVNSNTNQKSHTNKIAKNKSNKDKTIPTNQKSHTNIIAKNKSNKDKTIPTNDFLEFFLKLNKEIKKQSPNANLIYLCADTHLFQHGKIKIEKGNDTVNITQIIAGTGGTTLDKNISESKMNTDINKKTGEYTITYQVLESLSEHGFVEIRNGRNGRNDGNVLFTEIKKPTMIHSTPSRTRHATPSRRSRSTVKNKYIRLGNGLDFRFHSVKSNSSKRSTRRARVKRGSLYTRSAP